ncbi:MAG TPA: cytochrome c3 family protein [Anaerolineales bacterium]
MHLRIERLLIAFAGAALAAGATLIIAQAQDPLPADPNAPTQQSPACVACHTEFATEWQHGPHGQAASDPAFIEDWTSQGKPGACLVCHVTNYDPATGAWEQDGVACVACHGAMVAGHPKEPMPVNRDAELCARCHSDVRFGWQGWQGSTHYQRGMSCATCHDPHSASLKVIAPRDGSALYTDASQLCITCHKDVSMNFPYTQHQQQGVTCIDCHVTHSEATPPEAHTISDHSFKANLNSCNTCHSDQMHSPASALGTDQPVSVNVPGAQQLQQAGLNAEPAPVSPWGYAGLAALIGLAAGMVLAPWLEKWYSRATRRHHGGGDD